MYWRFLLIFAVVAQFPGLGSASAQCSNFDDRFRLDGVNGTVNSLVVLDLGSGPQLFVGGAFTRAGDVAARNIARWDGSSWSALGAGTNAPVDAIAAWDDGTGLKLFVGGSFTQAGSGSANFVARWDGATWSSLGTGTNGPVTSLAVYDEGSGPRLFVAGTFSNIPGTGNTRRIGRWNGLTWSPVGFGANSAINALSVYDDGTGPALYAAGGFTALGTNSNGDTPASHIGRWNGASWVGLNSGLDSYATTLATLDEGGGQALYVGGNFSHADGISADRAAKWTGTGWSAVGFGLDDLVYSFTVFDDGGGPALYAAGAFNLRIVKLNSGFWTSVALGTNANVLTLAVFNDGGLPKLWSGGVFTEMGSVPVDHLAKWDGSSWSAQSPGQGSNGEIQALAVHDDGSGPALYATGQFTTIGSQPIASIARWNGVNWNPVGTGEPRGFALLSQPSGPFAGLYVGGPTFLSTIMQNGVAYWDGLTWSTVGPGHGQINEAVYALIVFDDGGGPALYAGGLISQIGGITATNIAKFDGTNWSAVGNPGGPVFSLIVYDDGGGPALYAGGSAFVKKRVGSTWQSVGANTPFGACLAVFDDGTGPALYAGGRKFDGTNWVDLGTGLTDGGPRAMTVHDDGSGPALFMCGDFAFAGGVLSRGVAKWNGSSWSPLSSGLDAMGETLCAFDDGLGGGADLYFGGQFTLSGGVFSDHIAEWHACAGLGAPFCFGDGSGAACPCQNASPVGARQGCLNSLGIGGFLQGTGTASLSADTAVLESSQMPNSSALYFQGTTQQSGGSGFPFGDGLRCAGGSVVRLATKLNAGGASRYPEVGDALISVRGLVSSPGTRTYQVWYRNAAPYCTASTFNLTNGYSIRWTP